VTRFNSTQNTFRFGQVSKKYALRDDVQITTNAVELLQNMIPLPGGGATQRPGSWLAFENTQVENSTWDFGRIRGIPFTFSEDEAYLIMIGEKNDFRIAARSNAGYYQGYLNVTTNSTFPTWFEWKDIMRIHYAQSADKLYLVHPDMEPLVLVRQSPSTFVLYRYGLNDSSGFYISPLSRPYRETNISATTLTPSVTTGVGTLTASAALFDSNHVGAVFLLNQGGTNTGACLVTGYTNSTHVSIQVLVDFSATTATTNWQESSWSTYRGWPGTVTFSATVSFSEVTLLSQIVSGLR
jgi:hypothetical protein